MRRAKEPITNFEMISNSNKSGASMSIKSSPRARQHGFTMVELVVVVAIMLIVAAVAVPQVLSYMHMARLRGSANDYASLLQVERIRSVQDERFYSSYVLGQQAFVDVYPQSNTGASGSGGATIDNRDPQISISSEVAPLAATSAPDTQDLKNQFLPSGSTLAVKDGSLGGTSAVTFGPRGLPCKSQTTTGGTVCDSAGGATAFWVFFQDNVSQAWEGVTVNPAGRIQKWQHGGTGWSRL